MKKLFLVALVLINIGWISASGSGVVSDSEVIARASIEATEVLTSGLLSNLYGTTKLGGTANYASFDSAGVLSTRNVISSRDVVLLGNDDFLVWKRSGEGYISAGVSSSNSFVVTASIDVVSGTIMSTTQEAFGWTLVEVDNQACTTTCVTSAVLGFDYDASVLTSNSATSSDVCLCAGNA